MRIFLQRCWNGMRGWNQWASVPVIIIMALVYVIFVVVIWNLIVWIVVGACLVFAGLEHLCRTRPRVAAGVISMLLIALIGFMVSQWNPSMLRIRLSFKEATAVALPKFVIGKGMWIYRIPNCDGGDVDKMVARAKEAGLDYILVKTNDGSKWVDYNPVTKVKEVIEKFHAANMKVYAWGYVYGTYSDEEAKRAIEALDLGSDGYIFNAEIHMRNRYSAAEHQCLMLRSHVDANYPEKILGDSTFCRVQSQRGIPFEVYDRYCDVAMPQVYFSWFSGWSAEQAAAKTMVIWQSEQASWGHYPKPIIPTLECSSGAADMPATDPRDLEAAAKGFRGYYGVNFYCWDVSTEKLWARVKSSPGSIGYQSSSNAEKAWQEARLIMSGGE